MGSYKLRWSDESVRNLEDILDYLQNNWSEKVVLNFKENLSRQLDLILFFHFIYHRNARKRRGQAPEPPLHTPDKPTGAYRKSGVTTFARHNA